MDQIPALPAPVEPEKPDPTLLEQLEHIRQTEHRIAAIKAWLSENHPQLVGLPWNVYPGGSEIIIMGCLLGGKGGSPAAADVARRFPGEWDCGAKSVFNECRDWVARRGEVTVRIQGAEKIAPPPAASRLVTF